MREVAKHPEVTEIHLCEIDEVYYYRWLSANSQDITHACDTNGHHGDHVPHPFMDTSLAVTNLLY